MWIDIVLLLIVALLAFLGYVRGFFSQAWSVAALVVSFFIADPVMRSLTEQFGIQRDDSLLGDWMLKLLTGVIIFIVLSAIGYVVEKAVIQRFKLLAFGNRFLGTALGAIRGFVVATLVLWVFLFFGLNLVEGAKLVTPKQAPAAGSGQVSNIDELNHQIRSSRAVNFLGPYNPLNLFLLAKVKPYLPGLTGSGADPSVSPPKSIRESETYKKLIADGAFVQACREKSYLDILNNPSFRNFAQDKGLLEILEKSQH